MVRDTDTILTPEQLASWEASGEKYVMWNATYNMQQANPGMSHKTARKKALAKLKLALKQSDELGAIERAFKRGLLQAAPVSA